ncbi:DUF192 domain-containing protein [Brevundimonas phoenicis]|uniref:DUF192 domain-containing protein n=1 Tax=unclassified Brevundimonas TaxID=2622653 RepID=UPI0039B0DBD4
MMIRRRVVVRITLSAVVLSGVLMASACTRTGPMDASGQPLEALSVVTASGEHKFMVEIADDDAERARGLMFRPPLEDDRGMPFQFQTASEQSFWMKNTPSSLDIIYIDPRGRIVSIASHATPNSEAPIPSNGAANGVLELRAGRAGEIGAKPGDTIKHPFFRP